MLVEEIKKSIVEAGFKEGEKMPSVRKMAERLKLSANTVHKAYKELAADGQIKLLQGKGCFWGKIPEVSVVPEEDAYTVLEKRFSQDLDSGNLSAFDPLPSTKELSIRYKFSPYIVRKFLMRKVGQGVLRYSGYKFYFDEERSVTPSNYILFVHRCDVDGRLIIESERESDVFRTLSQIALNQHISVRFVGFNEKTDSLIQHDGSLYKAKNDDLCLGVFLSTWLVGDAKKLFGHFASFKGPISVWWEYAPDTVPSAMRNKKKWAFYNVAFGSEGGVIVGKHLLKKGVKKVNYVSPFHSSYWSVARLQGLQDAGVEAVALVDSRFSSPFDMMASAVKAGVDKQKYMNKVMESLLENASEECFVCSNDWVAISVIDYFKSKKKPVPYVIGFDNTIESYRYVFDSLAFNVGTMVKEAIYHILAPKIYAEQRRLMQTPLGQVVEKR